MNNVVFSPQTRSSIRIWGLIGAGVLAGIEIIWYGLGYVWLGPLVNLPISALIIDMNLSGYYMYFLFANIVLACSPVLAAMPVFFWISRQVAWRTGLTQVGVRATLQSCGWWAILKGLLLCLEIALHLLNRVPIGGVLLLGPTIPPTLLLIPVSYILAALFMFGAGRWMGTIGGRSGNSQSAMQVGYSSPHLGPLAPTSGTPLGLPPQQPIPQPLSALEILQQRFARGEIDSVTYQQMRAELEASARPHPNAHQ